MSSSTTTVSRILAAVTFFLLLIGLPLQAQQPVDAERHMVFAHYMTCFALSKEFCKQEIELAQRHGIDGFAMNCGGWGTIDPKTSVLTPERYVESTENMYAAAKELGTGFKLFISADVTGLTNLPIQMGDMVKRFYSHPNQFRYQGKAVISAWAGGPEAFASAINKMKSDGFKVCFVPLVMTPKFAMAWSPETVLRLFDGQPHMDGLFYFACDDSIPGTILQNANARRFTQYLGKIYMAGNVPSYNSANLRDFHGVEGYGEIWKGIIRDDADWVEIVTWNDYNEDSHLMAYRWKDGANKELYDHDESMLDATSYYSAWYKSGVQPKITQDKLYYCYRNRSRWLLKAWDPKKNEWIDSALCPQWPYEQIHDDVTDMVYVTTFLTAPANLTVRIGKSEKTFSQPAGIGCAVMPMSPGVPQFTLRRKDAVVLDVAGRKEIIGEPTKANSTYGSRLQNRAWTGGAAAGRALKFEAEACKLTAGAEIVKSSGVTAVKNQEKADSGFILDVTGLQTATYCIRVTYANPSTTESRLTMTADGASRGPNDYPYYIPVFLPPTGRDTLATVTCFWSLYSGTSRIAFQWKPGVTWDRPVTEADDKGSVTIDSIELVKVDPVVVPEAPKNIVPQMVKIPGGSFTMGTDKGDPDESPAHRVTVSPFAIGKFEVTNEEYEKFDPSHKQFRDGFSWRNREPVIYVSWTTAAQYCNWLSKQAGLAPVYDEKTWSADLKADGFRMPTEAEWEYVAAGRGEARSYPWGNKAPDASLCNFSGAQSLAVKGPISSGFGQGTVVVGSFPSGASRDGVMDLAGNVSEWCSDYYQPYSSDAVTDPCNQTPGNYRAIRGGSWGYYNFSQRCADREFNNPGYGGYIYLGFRVAISEAGLKKLAR